MNTHYAQMQECSHMQAYAHSLHEKHITHYRSAQGDWRRPNVPKCTHANTHSEGSYIFPTAKLPHNPSPAYSTHTPQLIQRQPCMFRDKVLNDDTQTASRATQRTSQRGISSFTLMSFCDCVARLPCLTCTRQTGSRAGSCCCT